jgi:hypothetical protein
MNKRTFFVGLAALVLVCSVMLTSYPVWADSTTLLLPSSYVTTSGSDGGQPVTNLHVKDQSGTQDDWNKYVEFQTPGSATYAGYRRYYLPFGINRQSITAIRITVNYKGPLKSYQTWTWKIYNWRTSSWVTLGDNTAAAEWRWTVLTFNATGNLADYVKSDTREIRIRLQSNNAKDNCDLDYEAVTITYTKTPVSPTVTPTKTRVPPTATPTKTRVPPTATPTKTPVPPTATNTPLPATPTNTPVPPTATPTSQPGACTRFVATTGNDNNPGTMDAPWKTIQKAANSVQPGDVVCVRGGTYNERVTINVSGTAGAYITFQSYPGETAILDGTGLTVPAGDNGMVYIKDRAYIIVKGFEIRNYKTSTKYYVPIGVRITGTSHHIEIRNNVIHHIEHNGTTTNGTDAHGIAVHGTSGSSAIHDIIIDGNALYSLKLGSSEALVINGNVDGWQVTNNVIHDVDNIGIDVIGFEGTAPSNDQARNGLIAYNDVYNINSAGNVAYGNERAAACVYVDGGRDVTIEYNKAHNCNIGVEIASEHQGKATSNVTIRNNFIYDNTDAGISMGGYDTQRGSTENCVIVNNTLYNNARLSDAWGAELYVQYDTRYNIIKNNIFYAASGKPYILSWSTVMTGNVMDYNLFFNGASWQWKNVTYTSFPAYQSGSGNDAHSLNGVNPLLVNLGIGDLHLQSSSPAIDAGQTLTQSGSYDIDGQPRVQGTSIDLGADEVR